MVNFGRLLEEEGKIEEATNLFLVQAGGNSGSAASANYCLGLMYLQGSGVEKNPAEGARWMLQSALLGHADAEMDMGVLYFQGTGVPRDEAQSIAWFKKAAAGGEVTAIKTLANCYCASGHPAEALGTLKSYSNKHPWDTDASLTLAAWQAWFRKKSSYEATRQRILKLAADTQDATVAQSAAKAYCLEPSTNVVLLAQALGLARMGAQFRTGTTWLPWYQLTLGMVQYRLGEYADAETNFSTAEQTAGKFQDVVPTARLYRAMCLFQQDHAAKARTTVHRYGNANDTVAGRSPPPGR
jgi:TPR repeat protein